MFLKNKILKIWEGIKSVFRRIAFDPDPPREKRKTVQKQFIKKSLFFAFCFAYFETVLHAATIAEFSWKFIYPIIFCVPIGMLVAFLTSLFRKEVNYVLSWILLLTFYVFAGAQIIYYKIFGSFISFSLMKMGGQAIKTFWNETLVAIIVNYIPLVIMAAPLLLYGLAAIPALKVKFNFNHRRLHSQFVSAVILIVTYLCSLCTLFIGGTGNYSPYSAFFSTDTTTEFSLNTLGAFQTMILELVSAGGSTTQIDDQLNSGTLTPITSSEVSGEDKPKPYTPKDYNMLNIDFDRLNTLTDDKDTITLNNYFKSVTPTEKNEYTGFFKGYNLITICAESFSPLIIDPDITPTLYRLANGGFIFDNFYNSYQSVTTNGEYTFCTGLFPDLSRNKSDGSFKASAKNLLPNCLGNMFASIGVKAFGYHNYKGSYYSRDISHPNMGYEMKFMHAGMKFTTAWPTSDLEMMQQSVDDYIDQPQFHAYYMTFSGHYRYSFATNPMCKRNEDEARELLKDRNYSEPIIAYYACNLELEHALTYLMDRLEQKGVLDKTVIVLTADHYPYGLNYNQYNELAGHTVDTKFGKFKNAFICYNSAMAPHVISTPCATPDILPTILNLFGFDFDSRLLAGTDILSDSKEHIAVMSFQSFITDKVMFDSGSNQTTYLVDKNSLDENYVEDHIGIVKQKLAFSSAILNTDYYRFVYENGIVHDMTE